MTRHRRIAAGLCVLLFLAPALAAASEGRGAVAPDAALARLVAGNKRYASGKPRHPNQAADSRKAVAKAQHPFAAVVCCSDSRVPPEILFDQGLGDLFVVRLAGNIVDDDALGSIEYAVEHLGVRFVLVLGHERCGAVTAAVEGGEAPGKIGGVVKAIAPAVEESKGKPGDPVENVLRANVRLGTERLRSAQPILADLVASGKVKVAGARYDLDTGVVEILP